MLNGFWSAKVGYIYFMQLNFIERKNILLKYSIDSALTADII